MMGVAGLQQWSSRSISCPTSSLAGEELSFPAFPYPPYDIQTGFMRALYRALEAGGVGLFESPTGDSQRLQAVRFTAPVHSTLPPST